MNKLTSINRCLADTKNQFYIVSVISVKYQLTQISILVIFYRYLTDANRYILEINTIGKIG